MEVKIGVVDIGRELLVKTESTAEEVIEALSGAGDGLFEISGEQGRRIVIPANKIAYLDFGAPDTRPVGFGRVS